MTPRQLFWRGVIAALGNTAMATAIYPLVPDAAMAFSRWRKDGAQPRGQVGVALREWAMAVGVSMARPCGFLSLPGAHGHGPRPVIVVHGYAMNRANFLVLARRLASAGMGPMLGFEYWTLGKTASAAKKLAAFVEQLGVTKELFFGSTLLERLRSAPLPKRTRMTVIWSRADGLVPGARQARVPGAEEIVFDDLGHLSMLASRRVAQAIIQRIA